MSGAILLVGIGLYYAIALDTPEERLGGLAAAVLGPLVLRVWCEAMIIRFRIHESIVAVLETLSSEESVPSDASSQ